MVLVFLHLSPFMLRVLNRCSAERGEVRRQASNDKTAINLNHCDSKMQSLFPQATQASAPLVQFRAGKCTMSAAQPNGKYRVTCDPKPGKIALMKGNDGLTHFKWLNGQSGAVEDDRIVFPGEYVFKKVKTGRENCTDRIFMLKYTSGNQRLMFWLQDKATDKDEENAKKVNDFLRDPNAMPSPTPAAGAAAATPAPGAVSPDEWMRMIGYVAPTTLSRSVFSMAELDMRV
jgi:hypothetical protein